MGIISAALTAWLLASLVLAAGVVTRFDRQAGRELDEETARAGHRAEVVRKVVARR